MSFIATRTGIGDAARMRPGTSRSHRRICARSSASSSPARVGEKSFSRRRGGSPHASASSPVVWRYSSSRNGSASRGRWYLTDGTTRSRPARVRSRPARSSARYSPNGRSQPRPFHVTVQPSRSAPARSQEEGRVPPRVRQQPSGMAVFVLTERLRESREVVLDRRYHQEPAGSGQVPPRAQQCEVLAERAIPAASFPRDGPALTIGARPISGGGAGPPTRPPAAQWYGGIRPHGTAPRVAGGGT